MFLHFLFLVAPAFAAGGVFGVFMLVLLVVYFLMQIKGESKRRRTSK